MLESVRPLRSKSAIKHVLRTIAAIALQGFPHQQASEMPRGAWAARDSLAPAGTLKGSDAGPCQSAQMQLRNGPPVA